MDWEVAEQVFIVVLIVVGLVDIVYSCITGHYTWHWYYNGVLGLPFRDSRTPKTATSATVEVSVSASAPTSSAANPDGVNAAVKPKVVQVRKRRKPVRLKRFARLA